MRIPGNEPSSVILSKTKRFQSWKWYPKVPKQVILIWTILMLSKRYELTKVDHKTRLHKPSETHWSTRSDTHQVVEIVE